MRRLMLLRHAKSDWPKGVSDRDRPLGPRGRHDAPHMGEEMALRGLKPDLAVISTAQRTRETWELVAPCLGPVEHRFESAIYEAEPKAILALIRAIDDGVGTLLVIGHNPGLELTAALLIGGGAERLRDRLGEKFPTAALAVIEFHEGGWADIGQGRGELALFLTPRDLD
ncbi:SixA phosphatase family protein [Labrys wisconsinensis]|uniref:Phosphohistidine phosphatase n=1 Tax=Labrys wisconsinensis TaxID=425677 RepID=A0ABU0JFI1_9HYPH|nr:histidine phosphatase family protein [Labrys wisconsinensis]MDQ0473050.1 phosphohistidine phosphatase [Labrys wisconsinensis]